MKITRSQSETDELDPKFDIRDPQSPIRNSQFEIRNSQSALVRAEGLTKSYESGRRRIVVFEDLSLEIAEGEMVAVVGPSGAGKSTLLHLLGGLDRPTEGTVKVGEFDIFKLGDV